MEYAKKVDGFTLVEVMVSSAIFLIASMGLLPLLMTSMQVNHDNSRHAQARRLAGEVMAELQVIDYAEMTMATGTPLLFDDVEVLPQVEQNIPNAGQSRLTVTAQWQQQGRSHRYQLQTIRSTP